LENFLLEYRDPLFGILVFLILVFIVSFFSYWWARYKKREEEEQLRRFFHKFEECADREILNIEQRGDTAGALLLLADAFERAGDFEKSIAIYLELSKKDYPNLGRIELLKRLGKVYFRAGFLEKSREIFVESLKLYPKDEDSLRYLMLIYERLRRFDKASQILESLEELGDFKRERDYFKLMEMIGNSEDPKKVVDFFKKSGVDQPRPLFEYLMKRNYGDWDAFSEDHLKRVADLLWRMDPEKIDYQKLKNTPFLKELFSARRVVSLCDGSDIFELDLLLALKRDVADLDFEYVCKECKNMFPFSFYRCPVCLAPRSPEVEMVITKKRGFDEESLSFQ